MPCGHGFCTHCIESCITSENKHCPTCKKEYAANSATELPVCYILEELLQKTDIFDSQKQNSAIEMGCVGMCPKHHGIPLYFHCNSHDIHVCHSCTVIDHPTASCNLISLDGEIKKQIQILSVQRKKQDLVNTEKDLENLLQKNIDYVTLQRNKKQELLNKIDKIIQEIIDKEQSQEKINDALKDCKKKQKSFEELEVKMNAATSYQDIATECDMAIAETVQSQKWEEAIRYDLNMRKVRCRKKI